MRTARVFLFGFIAFVFILLFFVFRQSVLAQSPSPTPQLISPTPGGAENPYIAPNTELDVPKNLHTYTQSVMLELASSLACQLGGIDPTDPHAKCLGVDSKTGKIGYVENGGGVAGVLSYMIAATFVNPVRSGDYVNYLASNFGFEKKAYAAPGQKECNKAFGLGYCGIFPLINIWATMRNMIYLLFVVIFMAIGLGIMLRVHIDPRTVMSVENQIPKIIIAIVLATFSFAIAGLMVDIMYTVIFLVYSVFSSIPGIDNIFALSPAQLQNTSVIGIGNNLSSDGLHGLVYNLAGNMGEIFRSLLNIHGFGLQDANPVLSLLNNIAGLFQSQTAFRVGVASPMDWIIDTVSLLGAWGIGTQATQIPPDLVKLVGGNTTAFLLVFSAVYPIIEASLRNLLPFLVPYLVILIAVIWALFRVWFALIQAYIFFLVDVVTAPFWMLAGLFPGSKLSFTGWFRDVAANLSAFVVAIVTIWLAKLFINAFGCVPNATGAACDTAARNFFIPPLIGSDLTTNVIGSIIGIATLLSLPDALRLTRAAFKPPEIDLKAAGRAIGAGPRTLGGAYGTVMSALSAKYYLTGVPGFKRGPKVTVPPPGAVRPGEGG